MSTVTINATGGFNTRDFWVGNTSDSTGEGFSGLESSSGGLLTGEQSLTYSEFTFQSGGLTYRYSGDWNVDIEYGLLTGTVTAGGTYNKVEVLSGDDVLATYNGPPRSVDFGQATGSVLDLVTNLLGAVVDLLFGTSRPDDSSYANLHLDATPNLPELAFGDGVQSVGGTGTDTIGGGALSDSLNGGAGADTLSGLGGNDTYFVDNAGDRIVEGVGQGSDTVRSSVTHTLAANVETLILTGAGSIDGTGNALNNTLTGNTGNNQLDGRGGIDTLTGSLGNDTYTVDNLGDRVVEFTNEGTDTVRSSVSQTLSANVENLILTGAGNLKGTGNALANSLTGSTSNDTLDGKLGADILKGGLGNDVYFVDNAGDTIVELAGQGRDTVNASVSYTLAANVESLILTNASNVSGTGNAGTNTLTGSSGANQLAGLAGNDSLTGGLGGDTFVFKALGDSTVAGAGRDTIQDFSSAQHDRLDLRLIDANTGLSGDQAFHFIGDDAFSRSAGEVRFASVGESTVVSADVNGDGAADFAVTLKGDLTLHAGDFLL